MSAMASQISNNHLPVAFKCSSADECQTKFQTDMNILPPTFSYFWDLPRFHDRIYFLTFQQKSLTTSLATILLSNWFKLLQTNLNYKINGKPVPLQQNAQNLNLAQHQHYNIAHKILIIGLK